MHLGIISKKPMFSTEQREFYENEQQKILDKLGYLFVNSAEFRKFPSLYMYFDYQKFLQTDIRCGMHPIQLLFSTIENYYNILEDKKRNLNVKYELGELTEEEYGQQLTDLLMEKLKVDAEINLQAKREYKKIYKESKKLK
jgi:hypothetical protein